MTKRIATVLLSLNIFLATVLVAPVGVNAQQSDYFPNNWQDAENIILSAWDNYEEEADISKCNVLMSDCDVFCERISCRNPEYFYVNCNSVEYSNDQNTISIVYFAYDYSISEILLMKEKFEQSVQAVLDLIPQGLDDIDKLLFLYDYIAINNNYDFAVFTDYEEILKPEIHTAYGCIVNNLSICEGISKAFLYFCKRLEIEAYSVASSNMDHEWNMVKLGNNYYHIDITYASPGFYKNEKGEQFQPYGFVSHDYFLLSDSQIKPLDHYDWDIQFSATDSTTFGSAFWKNALGQIGFADGFAYYISNGKLSKCNLSTGKITNIYTLPNCYYITKDGYTRIWVPFNTSKGFYTAFTFDSLRKNLYFAMGNSVYAYNIDNNSIVGIHSLSSTGYIFSLSYNKGKILMITNDTNSKIPTKKYYYGTESISTSILPDYSNSYVTLAGDIDCDGRISVSDVLALKKYLAKSNVDISIVNANVNKDDKIDLLDLARLKVIYINM